jgi:hypothetical protein
MPLSPNGWNFRDYAWGFEEEYEETAIRAPLLPVYDVFSENDS